MMKSFSIYVASVASIVAVGVFTAASAVAASRCDNPNGMIEQRACAKAAEGADALRRFVTRTASIYALSYFDFARGDETSAPTAATSKR